MRHDLVVLEVGAYLRAKAPIPGLSKYQQVLVRPSLSTILNPLIGILDFDSDSASVPEFMGAARAAAVMCGEILTARLAP